MPIRNLGLCDAHPIKLTVTGLFPGPEIRGKSTKRFVRYFWTFNRFSESISKNTLIQLVLTEILMHN